MPDYHAISKEVAQYRREYLRAEKKRFDDLHAWGLRVDTLHTAYIAGIIPRPKWYFFRGKCPHCNEKLNYIKQTFPITKNIHTVGWHHQCPKCDYEWGCVSPHTWPGKP